MTESALLYCVSRAASHHPAGAVREWKGGGAWCSGHVLGQQEFGEKGEFFVVLSSLQKEG